MSFAGGAVGPDGQAAAGGSPPEDRGRGEDEVAALARMARAPAASPLTAAAGDGVDAGLAPLLAGLGVARGRQGGESRSSLSFLPPRGGERGGVGPPAAAGDRSLGLASASSFVGGDEGFEGVGGMGPPPPRRAERQGDRGADRGWEGGGGSSRGRAPVDDRAFDMDVDAGASARDLAATLDFEYVGREPAARRRGPPPRDDYYGGGGGDGASRATPYGGGLRYDEDAPSSMRRGAPADIPRDVGGWARGDRSRDPRLDQEGYQPGGGWQGGRRQGGDPHGDDRYGTAHMRGEAALGFGSPSADARFNDGAGRGFNPSVSTGVRSAGAQGSRRAGDSRGSPVGLVVPSAAKPPAPGLDTAARALRLSARNKRVPRPGETRRDLVRLFEYTGDVEEICGGRVKCRGRAASLVCCEAPRDCELKHNPKCHDQLRPGWYVTNVRGNAIFPEHFVSAATAEASLSFGEVRGEELPLPAMVRLLQSIREGADSKPADVRKFVRVAASAPAVTKTPARARPVRPAAPAGGEDAGADAHLPPEEMEALLDDVTDRLAALEGNVGVRGDSSGPATLWEAAHLADERVGSTEEFAAASGEAQVDTRTVAEQALALARSAARSSSQYAGGAAAGLQATVLEQDRVIRAQGAELVRLGVLVKQLQDIVLGVVSGSVPLAAAALPGGRGAAAGGPFVTQTAFDSERANTAYHRSILEQTIGGGGVMLGSVTFTVLEDSRSFSRDSLPPGVEVFECFVGLMAALQSIRSTVVSTQNAQAEELHEVKTKRTSRQSSLVASFATTVPVIFGKTSALSALGTFVEYDACDGTGGLKHVVLDGVVEVLADLAEHAKVALEGWPAALKLSEDIAAETQSFVVWFVPRVAAYYMGLVGNASPNNTCTGTEKKELKESCWKRTINSLKAFFKELRAVRRSASSAQNAKTVQDRNALFLHATLQELRVMRLFKEQDWKNHPAIQQGLVEHIHQTYLSRSAWAGTSGGKGGGVETRLNLVESKLETQAKTVGQQRKDITALQARG